MSVTRPRLNGKNGSRLSKASSGSQPKKKAKATRGRGVEERKGLLYPSELLEAKLRAVFDDWRRSSKLRDRAAYRHDFVFHMTDWLNDLEKLSDLYDHPEKYPKDEASDIVFGFFIHAMSHLKAAERILLDKQDQCDPFGAYYHEKDQRVV